MKKFILTLAILTLFFQSCNAQWWSNDKIEGNGNYTSENRSVSDYDGVSLKGFMDVELISGTEGELVVEAENNFMEYLITEVSNGILEISVKKGVNLEPSRGNGIKITVPFESLEVVSLSGSGDLYSSEVIHSRNFEVRVSGSGDVSLKVEAETAQAEVVGSGDLNLQGSARELECEVNGSGDIDAARLKAAQVTARVTGSGDIAVYATEVLRSRVTGSGDIEFLGDPAKQDFKTTGSGSISRR